MKTAYVIPAAIALALFLIRLAVKLLRQKSRRKRIHRQAEDKLREEALDRALVGKVHGGTAGTPVPYDVKYDLDQRRQEKGGQRRRERAALMLQLTERSELSTRKYMFHMADGLVIGSQARQSDIVIPAAGVAAGQCEIFRIGTAIYAKNLAPENTVLLQRRSKQCSLELEAVRLKTRDVLQIGTYQYEIVILHN